MRLSQTPTMETPWDLELDPEPPTKHCANLRTCFYASCSSAQASSSGITKAPGSAISMTPSESPSFSIFDKKSAVQKDGARPRSVVREPVLP
ncbi:hypothetical protein DY000_02052829 [Brassica cretica]|uniref:Uncharacterized protein n=1 Tax=Brassica cretica TaxID=69181 RepID=A0ABQ7A7M6_BRACR|nr:hypothetical protein DY000_02052829 [Brassica cretica]